MKTEEKEKNIWNFENKCMIQSNSIQRLRKIYCVLYMLIIPSIKDIRTFESNNKEWIQFQIEIDRLDINWWYTFEGLLICCIRIICIVYIDRYIYIIYWLNRMSSWYMNRNKWSKTYTALIESRRQPDICR